MLPSSSPTGGGGSGRFLRQTIYGSPPASTSMPSSPSSLNSTSSSEGRAPAFPGVNRNDAYMNGAASTTATAAAAGMGLVGRLLISLSTVCGFFLLLALAIWLEKRRERAARSAAVAAAAARQQEVDDPIERYRNIEKWLVTKRVEAHDDVCETVLQALVPASMRKNNNNNEKSKSATIDLESSNPISDSSSCSTDEQQQHEECPICFEAFRVGELISWSANPKCSHVYHHICVKEWLRKNKECPYCRETFLPIDRHHFQGSVMTLKKINELILAQQTRSAHCYYCLEHGVVRPPSHYYNRKHVNAETIAQIQQRSEHLPSLEELSKLRGVAACCCGVGGGDTDDDGEYCHPVVAAAPPTTAVLSSRSSSSSSFSSSSDNDDDDDDDVDDYEQSLRDGGAVASNTFLGEDDDFLVIAEEPEYDDERAGCGRLQNVPTTTTTTTTTGTSLRSESLGATIASSLTTASMSDVEVDRRRHCRRERRRRRLRRSRRVSIPETQLDTVTPHETWGYHLP